MLLTAWVCVKALSLNASQCWFLWCCKQRNKGDHLRLGYWKMMKSKRKWGGGLGLIWLTHQKWQSAAFSSCVSLRPVIGWHINGPELPMEKSINLKLNSFFKCVEWTTHSFIFQLCRCSWCQGKEQKQRCVCVREKDIEEARKRQAFQGGSFRVQREC